MITFNKSIKNADFGTEIENIEKKIPNNDKYMTGNDFN